MTFFNDYIAFLAVMAILSSHCTEKTQMIDASTYILFSVRAKNSFVFYVPNGMRYNTKVTFGIYYLHWLMPQKTPEFLEIVFGSEAKVRKFPWQHHNTDAAPPRSAEVTYKRKVDGEINWAMNTRYTEADNIIPHFAPIIATILGAIHEPKANTA